MTETIVLAFDIERSGSTNQHDTIALGISVVDSELKELDSLCMKCYFPKETRWEARCWDEFWSKHLDILQSLEYKGINSPAQQEICMIKSFHDFRKKWEGICQKQSKKLELVSDNKVYDGGFINILMYDHMPNTLPIPYNTNAKYSPFWETHSIQRGILFVVDPTFDKDWGMSKRINELFEVPRVPKSKSNVQHDHNPANDAYVIATEHQVTLGIRDGKIKLKRSIPDYLQLEKLDQKDEKVDYDQVRVQKRKQEDDNEDEEEIKRRKRDEVEFNVEQCILASMVSGEK